MLLGQRVADRVGEVDRRRAGLDRRARDIRDEGGIRACRVLAAELDLVDPTDDVSDRAPGPLEDLGRLETQLVLHVDRARPEDDVDARPSARVGKRLDCGVEILHPRPGERRNRRPGDRRADCANAFEVTGRGEREARLDHVDAQGLECQRDLGLLVRRERDARGLLSVPERGVEDRDPSAVLHVRLLLSGASEDAPVLCLGRRLRLEGA